MPEQKEKKVLYICKLPSGELRQISPFSIAGENKMKGFIQCFQYLNYDIDIFSPIFVPRTGFAYKSGFRDRYMGETIIYPPILRIHPIINLIFVLLSSVIILIKKTGEEYDTIVFYNFEPQYCLPAILAKYIFNATLIVECEDGLVHRSGSMMAYVARVLRKVTPLDGAFLVNSLLKDTISTRNTAVIRGVESVYDIDQNSAKLKRKRNGSIILFSGGFRKGKGIDLFLDAIKEYQPIPGEQKFLICGHGKKQRKRHIQSRVNKLDTQKVEFLGRVEPWESYLDLLCSSDILVALENPNNTYNTYCFPSKLIEYAKTGNTVISSNISDIEELSPQPFIILEEYEPVTLAEKFEKVLQYESTNTQQITNEWLQQECSVETVSGRIDKIIRSAS